MKKYFLLIGLLGLTSCLSGNQNNDLAHKYEVNRKYKQEFESTVHIVTTFVGDDMELHQSAGSGIYLKHTEGEESFILTAAHVVDDDLVIDISTYQCSVPFEISTNCVKVPVEVMAINPEKDLAILKSLDMSPTSGPVAKLAPTYPLLGDEITVIGSPTGRPHSIYTGVLASVATLSNRLLYQISAPITNGNSGGPVFDKNGYLIGIVDLGLIKPIIVPYEGELYIVGIIPIPGMNYVVALPELVNFLAANPLK